MVIQDLKPSAHVAGRWLAVLEDGSILRVGELEVVNFSLYRGKELSEEEAQALLDSAKTNELKEKALNLLARKPMSRLELERKLESWEAGEDQRESICDRLEELGLLNDLDYGRRVVRHFSAKGYGERKLRDELYRRGVPREYWAEALEEAGEQDDVLDALLEKKLRGSREPADLKRASDALARRGYRWSEIRAALNRLGAGIGED